MLQILPQGDDVYHLVESGSRHIGWIRGAAIRIGAFATERQAITGALHGARVLDAYLRGGPTRRTPPADGVGDDIGADEIADAGAPGRGARPDVRLVHDGAYEWIVVGRRPLARLIRPRAPRVVDVAPPVPAGTSGSVAHPPAPRATRHDFAQEFVVPASVAPMARPTIARVLHRAFARAAALEVADTPAALPPLLPRADRSSLTTDATGVRASNRTPVPSRAGAPPGEESDPADPPPAA